MTTANICILISIVVYLIFVVLIGVKYSKESISDEHLLGFMQTTWESVTPEWQEYLIESTEPIKAARDWFENNGN